MQSLMRNGCPRPPIPPKPDGWKGVYFHDRSGELHPSAKLTGDEARWVVRCVRNGVPRESVAALIGISACSVYAIINGKRYASETVEERRR